MDEYREVLINNDGEEVDTENCDEEELEELLKEIDRDQYYWANNLIDEYSELDDDIREEWQEDVDSLDKPYRDYVIRKIKSLTNENEAE